MGFMDKVKSKVSAKNETEEMDEAVVEESAPKKDKKKSSKEDAQQQKKIEDILEILQIAPTFEVPAEVFLPEDLKTVDFDIQVPSGYDTGQVTRFVAQTRNSVKFLVDLLQQRNEDVAKMATTVDRLQVDVNNLRYDLEIGNGINIMPTEDDPDLESKLMEAKLQIRRQDDLIKKLEAAGAAAGESGLSDQERAAYNTLQDELSIAKKNLLRLEEENQTLRSRLGQLEEAGEDELDDFPPSPKPLSREELIELGLPLDDEDDFTLPGSQPAGISPKIALPLPDQSEITYSEEADGNPFASGPSVARGSSNFEAGDEDETDFFRLGSNE